ncbi:MAG: class I SAM-dependent methyltransferase [Chloroflexi bacterium]|nr:class I SAM-dependent methyltransferase [Chloroflexota bacterium]
MSQELETQKKYWDRTVTDFDSIYSHRKSKFDNWVDATFRWDMYARFDYTMAHSEPIAGRAFLEVGCGTGRYALEYARRGAVRVVGIDIAANMLDVCRERAQTLGVSDRCEWAHSDLLAYAPREKFDVVIGIGLFDYIRDALPVLAKMRQVATDRAIVTLPMLETWRAPVRKVRLALKRVPVYFYSRARVDELMKGAGFGRYEMERIGQLWCVTGYVSRDT